MKKAIAVLLITVMALSFAACAKKGDATVEKVVGTWCVNTQATLNGQAATEDFYVHARERHHDHGVQDGDRQISL